MSDSSRQRIGQWWYERTVFGELVDCREADAASIRDGGDSNDRFYKKPQCRRCDFEGGRLIKFQSSTAAAVLSKISLQCETGRLEFAEAHERWCCQSLRLIEKVAGIRCHSPDRDALHERQLLLPFTDEKARILAV